MKKVARSSLINDFPKMVLDPEAETIMELCSKTSRSRRWVQSFAAAQVACGNWEIVRKMVPHANSKSGYPAPAYRRRKRSIA